MSGDVAFFMAESSILSESSNQVGIPGL